MDAQSWPESPLVSIIIPARNEAEDIARTLEACLALDYPRTEVVVVDDSTDRTPQIVASYAGRGVRLIHRERNRNGCCGARNVGMRAARGDIVVLMNADAVPRPDFLDRLLVHYRAGADYVIVRSVVRNPDNPWGQLIAAEGEEADDPDPQWSEGFSCRRAAAEAAGYIPGDFPVPFCRDWTLGAALAQAGFRKQVDLTIEMEHVSPSTLRAYWYNQVWRGSFSAPFGYYLRHMSVTVVASREVLKGARALGRNLLVVPALWRAARLSRHTVGRWRRIPSLWFAGAVQDIALSVGNFQGLYRVVRAAGEGRTG